GFDVTVFRTLKEKLADPFPHVEEHNATRWAFKKSEAVQGPQIEPHLQGTRPIGLFFYSSDRKNVAQFREDGFTFSRLKPYSDWADVFARASALWRLYQDTVGEADVTRIAT